MGEPHFAQRVTIQLIIALWQGSHNADVEMRREGAPVRKNDLGCKNRLRIGALVDAAPAPSDQKNHQ